MEKTFDDLYSELSKNADFIDAFGQEKNTLKEFLETVPDADRQIEEMFGVTNASATLKKKESTLPAAEGEGSSLPSLSVGQTEDMVDPAPVGGPVQGADIGPRPGMKSGKVSRQNNEAVFFNIQGQYQATYRQIETELNKEQPNTGLLNAQLHTFSNLYNQFAPNDDINSDFDAIINQLRGKYNIKVENGRVAIDPKKPASLSAPSMLGTPAQVKNQLEEAEKFEYIRGEKFRRGDNGELLPVFEPVTERQRAVESYLFNYKYGTPDAARADELSDAFDFDSYLKKTNFYVPTAILQRDMYAKTDEEGVTTPGDIPLTPGGPFAMSNAGNVYVDPVWVEREAERFLRNSELLTPFVIDNVNTAVRAEDRRTLTADSKRQITKEDAIEILLPQVARLLTREIDTRLVVARAEQKLVDKGIYVEAIQREYSKELADYQKTVIDETALSISKLREEALARFKPLYDAYKAKTDELTAQYKARLETELNEPGLSDMAARSRKLLIDEDYLRPWAIATEEWQNQVFEIEKDLKSLAANVLLEDKLRREEKEKYFLEKYGPRFEAYKKQFEEAIKELEVYDLRSFGDQIGDVMVSRTATILRGMVDATSAQFGVENNPFAPLAKYFELSEKKRAVSVKAFSKVLDESGFLSSEAFKTAILNVAQQIPNYGLIYAATVLSGNWYSGMTVAFFQDSMEQAGSNYRLVFEKTGSVVEAEKAAHETWKAQWLMLPTYAFQAFPFVSGWLSGIGRGTGAWGLIKKAAVAIGVESGTEGVIQEPVQQYMTYSLTTENPKDYWSWYQENGANVFIDILPATVMMGAVGAGREQIAERDLEATKERAMETLGELGLVDMLNTIAPVVGKKGVFHLAEYLFMRGAIDKAQFAEMKKVIGDLVEVAETTKGVITESDLQRYYVQVAMAKKKMQQKMADAEAKGELTEEARQLYQDRIDNLTVKLRAIAAGNDRRYSKVKIGDNTVIVVANETIDAAIKEAQQNNPSSIVLQVADSEAMSIETEDSKLKATLEEFFTKFKAAREERRARRKQEEETAREKNKPFESVGPQTISPLSETASQASLGVTVDQKEAVIQMRQKYEGTGKSENDRIDEAERLQGVLDEVLPGVKIVLMEDAAYQEAAKRQGRSQSDNGSFFYTVNPDGSYSGEVYININRANASTVAHEVAHPLMIAAWGANPEKFNELADVVASVLPEGSDFKKKLMEFTEGYFDFMKGEEFLAQFAAIARENQRGDLSLGVLQNVAQKIAKFLYDFTNGKVDIFNSLRTKAEILDFFNALSRTLATGQVDQRFRQKGTDQRAETATEQLLGGPTDGSQPNLQSAQETTNFEEPTSGISRNQLPYEDVKNVIPAFEGLAETSPSTVKEVKNLIFQNHGKQGTTIHPGTDGTFSEIPGGTGEGYIGLLPGSDRVANFIKTREEWERGARDYGDRAVLERAGKPVIPNRLFTGHKVSFAKFDKAFRGSGLGNQTEGVYLSTSPLFTANFAKMVATDGTYYGLNTGEENLTFTEFVSEVKLKGNTFVLFDSKIPDEIVNKIGIINGINPADYETFFDYRYELLLSYDPKVYEDGDLAAAQIKASDELSSRGITGYAYGGGTEVVVFDEEDAIKISQTRIYENDAEMIADQYYTAKQNNENPDFVKAVEDIIDNTPPNNGVTRSQLPNQKIQTIFNNATSPQVGFENALREGYNFKQIQQAVGKKNLPDMGSKQFAPFADAYRNIINEALTNAQVPLERRIQDAQGYVDSEFETWGRSAQDVYDELRKMGYTDHEIFLAFAKDGKYIDEAREIFGNEYRQTIENILDTENLIPALDAIRTSLKEDSRNLHVQMRAAEIVDIMTSLGLGVIEPGLVATAFLDYLNEKNVPANMIGFVTMLKDALDKNALDPDIAANLVQKAAGLFSFGGRMLQLARNFAKQDPVAIIEAKMNAEGIVLTAAQKQKLRTLATEVQAAQTQLDEDVKLLKGEFDDAGNLLPGSVAWTDTQFMRVDQSRNRLMVANSELAKFLSDRKVVLWNEKYVAGMKKGLLSLTTPVLSFIANVEALTLSRLLPGRFIGMLRDLPGGPNRVKSRTFSFANSIRARAFSKRQTRDAQWNSFKYGNITNNVQLEKYFDSAGGVDFFKDPLWFFSAMKTLIYNATGKNIQNMTQEELADAFNLTLTKSGEKGVVELRDGVGYSILRSFAWTFNTGAYAAVMGSNPLYYFATGPFATELTGRMMAYGGDIAFGNLAAKRAMIDYVTWLAKSGNLHFKDGVLKNHLMNQKGQLDEQALRALCAILDSYSGLRQPFEEQGLRRTLMADNFFTKGLSLAASVNFSVRGVNIHPFSVRKTARNLYMKNRSDVQGTTPWREVRRQATFTGLAKNLSQTTDVFLSTLMPFVTVPTNYLGQLVTKGMPPLAGLKYFHSEWAYRKAKADFMKKWPENKKLQSENQRVQYEKAKIDLFFKKRQVTFDAAQFTNSFFLYWYVQTAVAAGALTVRGDEEKEKLKLLAKIKSAGYNFKKHMAYLDFIGVGQSAKYAVPGAENKRAAQFQIWYRSQNKTKDFIIGTPNLGFMGGLMNIHQQSKIYEMQELESRAISSGAAQLAEMQNKVLTSKDIDAVAPRSVGQMLDGYVMAGAFLGSVVNNLPALQGIDRIASAFDDVAKGKDRDYEALQKWAGGTLATSLAVYFPGVGSTFSKGRAQYPQSIKDIFPKAEDDWTTFLGVMSLELVQRLNPKYAFMDKLESDFYKERIGIFGEDLSKKVTMFEPGTLPSYLQAMIDPFQVTQEGSGSVWGDQYKASLTIVSGLMEFANVYYHATGRDYPYKQNGQKASSFFAAASHPIENKFEFESDNPNEQKQSLPYNLPNDLYRRYLQTRGVYVARAFRNTAYVEEFNKARDFIEAQAASATTDAEWEAASKLIAQKVQAMFDLYDTTMSSAIKQFEAEYIKDGVDATSGDKKMPKISRNTDIAEMIKRGLFTPAQIQVLVGYGLPASFTK